MNLPKSTVERAARPGLCVERILLAAILLSVVWFYVWRAFPEGGFFTVSHGSLEYYNQLVNGFLKGKLSLDHEVPEGLKKLKDPYDPIAGAPYRLHDASYYKGAYYIYFGVTPAATLFLPFHVLSGAYITDAQAVVVFCAVGFGAWAWLICAIRRRHFPGAGTAMLLLSVLSVGTASMLPTLLSRASVWEVPISSAMAYFALSMALLFQALHGRRQCLWLAGASLCYGLAVGARADYAFGATALLVPVGYAWREDCTRKEKREGFGEKETAKSKVARAALAAVVPIAIVVAGLLLYNYLRFENPFEFGDSYQMAGSDERHMRHFSLGYFLHNARIYFLAPPRLSAYFPFVRMIHPPSPPRGYFGIEDPFGILPSIPFVLLTLAVPFCLRSRSALGAMSLSLLLGGVFTGATTFLFWFASNRYMVDFLPALIGLACIGLFGVGAHASAWFRNYAKGLAVFLLIWSLVFNMLASLGHNELLKVTHHALYAKIARIGNEPTYWLDRLVGTHYGPIDLRVILPRNRLGKVEPLLVTGVGFLSDYLYLVYTAPGEVVIGFEHAGYGGPVSAPISLDPEHPHKFHIEMGSLYPPVEHPFYDGLPPNVAQIMAGRLRVAVEGVIRLDKMLDFYDAVSRQPSIGFSPENVLGGAFTGQVLGWSRSAPMPDPPRPETDSSLISTTLILPQNQIGRSEPLVCSGETGHGDVLFITYLDNGHIQVGLDHWGSDVILSAPISVDWSKEQVFKIGMGSVFSSIPKSRGPVKSAPRDWRRTLYVRLNGIDVLDQPAVFFYASPESVLIGRNRIGASTCGSEFTGKIISLEGPDAIPLPKP